MKKKVQTFLGLGAVVLLSLTACGRGSGSNGSETSKPQSSDASSTSQVESNTSASASTSSQEVSQFDGYFKINQDDYKVTFNDLRTSWVYACEANQKGDVRALVVPVDFTDFKAEDLPAGAEGTRAHIQKAIFGDPTTDPEINWESLHSFYQKSSYGQCNITGDVTPWWHTNKTAKNFDNTYTVDLLVKDIQDYYSQYGDGADLIDLNDYDANDDGYVDLLLMVYSCPTGDHGGNDGKTFWAYTTQLYGSNGQGQWAEEAIFSRYWWASVEFMYNDNGIQVASNLKYTKALYDTYNAGNLKVDAHTYIHETGHGLGLADYYSYDYNGDAPMGGIDMMDHNIGDHNAYSKSLYGWISPYVVEGDCEITIKPFEQNGDAIIVPIREKNWRENSYTLLDEYLIIQYDTPEGLAVADGLDRYDGGTEQNTPLYYNIPGIRILHTDSRIGLLGNGKNEKGEYEKQLKNYVTNPYLGDGTNTWTDFAHDNTATRTFNDCKLLEVVEPNKASKDGYQDHLKGLCDNNSLWQTGDVLANYHCNTVKSNSTKDSKYDLGFSIEIGEMNEQGCTLKFKAI